MKEAFEYIKENFNLDKSSEDLLDEIFKNLGNKLTPAYSMPTLSLELLLQPKKQLEKLLGNVT